MSRKARENAEKRAAKIAAAASQQAEEGARRFRKNMVRNTVAALALAGVAGSAAHFGPRAKPAPQAVETSAAEPATGYLSVTEGVELYNGIRKTIETKLAEIGDKPLRIAMLSDHNSPEALAYELMVIDIADRLRIKALEVELSEQEMQAMLRDPNPNGYTQGLRHVIFCLNAASKRQFALTAVDTRYPTNKAGQEGLKQLFIEKFKDAVAERFHVGRDAVTGATMDTPDSNVNNIRTTVFYDTQFYHKLNLAERTELEAMLPGIVGRAMYEWSHGRSVVMAANLKAQTRSSVYILGFEHGRDTVEPLLESGQAVLAFAPAARRQPASADPQRNATVQWAGDPANAVQYDGKPIDPRDVPGFVDRVSQQANNKGIGR